MYVRVIHKQKWRKSEAVVVTFFIHWISAKLKKNKNKDERVRESKRERESNKRERKPKVKSSSWRPLPRR